MLSLILAAVIAVTGDMLPIHVPMPCKSCALKCVYQTYPDADGNFLALCHEKPLCDDLIFKSGFEEGPFNGPYEAAGEAVEEP